MGYIKFFLIAVIAVFFVNFCVVNREVVSVSLFPLPYTVDIIAFILVLLSVSVGVVVSGFLFSIQSLKNRCQIKKLQQRVVALENENKVLRSEHEFTLPALIKQPK